MKNTVGLVPSFFKRIPDEFLDYEGERFTRIEGQNVDPAFTPLSWNGSGPWDKVGGAFGFG